MLYFRGLPGPRLVSKVDFSVSLAVTERDEGVHGNCSSGCTAGGSSGGGEKEETSADLKVFFLENLSEQTISSRNGENRKYPIQFRAYPLDGDELFAYFSRAN